MIHSYEMVHTEMSSGHGQFQFDPHCLWGHMPHFPNLNIHPLPSSSQNFANHLEDHNNSNSSYRYQYKYLQNHPPVANMEIGSVAPINPIYDPYMVSSSGRWFHVPIHNGSSHQIPISRVHGVLGPRIIEHGGTRQFFDNNWVLNKRKNYDEVHGNYPYMNGVSDPGTSNFGFHRNISSEAGASSLNTPFFAQHEPQVGFHPIRERSPPTTSNQTGTICHPHEHPLVYYQGQLVQGNYTEQSFQPGNAWVDQFGSSVCDARGPNWNYTHTIAALPGVSVNRVSEIENFDNLSYQDSITRRNFAAHLHSLPTPNPHHDLLQVPGMNIRNHNHRQLAAPPYCHLVNMHHGIVQPSRDVVNSESRFPRPYLHNGSDHFYEHARHPTQPASTYNDVFVEMLSIEDASSLDFSSFEIENLIDRHRDMRLDIDSMTYEELLALQEQIGDVNTGLSDEIILKHLHTRIHLICTSLSLSIQPSSNRLENGTCIICQVDFEERERIGILDCGHEYHADCIKQWLLVKNLCPICKTTGLNMNKIRGAFYHNG